MTSADVRRRLCAAVDRLLMHPACRSASVRLSSCEPEPRETIVERAWEDLCAYATRDAAAAGDPGYVLGVYASFQAVLAYRVAHRLLCASAGADPARIIARRLSEMAKVRTGVEIHPAAAIGRRFVIDHGLGTVIGEQVRTGDDCYFLQGVVLGGHSIGFSSVYGGSRRHPWIGDRVQIGGGAMVLGPVVVGDDCRLGPGVRVTTDVPAGARVKLVATNQVTLTRRQVEVHSVVAVPGGLLVKGTGLANLTPALLDRQQLVISPLPVRRADDSSIQCGRPDARVAGAKFVGLFEEARLACYVGCSALHDL